MKYSQQEVERAKEFLHELLDQGNGTVYCVLKHVSRSGMFRVISLNVRTDDGITNIDWAACRVLGERLNQKHDGVPASGCGMDMGFHLVYSLSSILYRDEQGPVPYSNFGSHFRDYRLQSRWL